MWRCLIGGSALAGFGLYNNSVPMLLVALIVVCGFRIYEDLIQATWLPLWRTIISKYENAAISHNKTSDQEADHAS